MLSLWVLCLQLVFQPPLFIAVLWTKQRLFALHVFYTILLKKKHKLIDFCVSLNSNIVSSEGLKEDFGQNREHPGDASVWSWWSHQLHCDDGGDAFDDWLLPALDCLKSCTGRREFSHPGTCVIRPGLWAIHVHAWSVLWPLFVAIPKWTGKLWVAQMACKLSALVCWGTSSSAVLECNICTLLSWCWSSSCCFLFSSTFARSSEKLCISRKISCRSKKHRPTKERWFSTQLFLKVIRCCLRYCWLEDVQW